MRMCRTLFLLFFFIAKVVGLHGQQLEAMQMASLQPSQKLAWHRISPTAQQPDGPVLYQLVFRFVAHDGTLTGTGSMAQPLAIAPGGVGAAQLAAGAVTGPNIAPGAVVKSLNGQTDTVTLAGTNGLSASTGAGTVTMMSNATPVNTASTIVSRDASGNFAAGTITVSGITLARGYTMKGAYGVSGVATAGGQFFEAAFSFPFPLAGAAKAPDANFIPAGGASTTNCPGSPTNPQAAAGNLCVYEAVGLNRNLFCIASDGLNNCSFSDPFGGGVFFQAVAAGQFASRGSWAVTVP